MSVAALAVEGLKKSFRGVSAVECVNLQVFGGEIVGLIGDNGAGKTTTLRAILGEVRADAGEVRITGSLEATARRRVGYVSQDAELFPDLTGRENLRFLACARGLTSETETAVDEALALADLGAAADRLTREYSGGMVRRLALSGAFLGGTALVVLDEAFQGLDPGAALRYRDRLVAFAESGGGALVCSHDLALLARISGRVLLMRDGRVVEELPGGDVEALESCFS